MVKYENFAEGLVRAYSTDGFMIERDGVQYMDAIDPVEYNRQYTETDVVIDEDAINAAYAEAGRILMGVN
jgi:hypothetical protein